MRRLLLILVLLVLSFIVNVGPSHAIRPGDGVAYPTVERIVVLPDKDVQIIMVSPHSGATSCLIEVYSNGTMVESWEQGFMPYGIYSFKMSDLDLPDGEYTVVINDRYNANYRIEKETIDK